jgi:uncharacterized membrane protein (DUF4010 family)
VHAATASAVSLVAKGTLDPSGVLTPVLIAFSANTGSKIVAAFVSGGSRYGMKVAAGLVCVAAAAWAPFLWGHITGPR